ncbi:MAG: DUF2723 domain-containing protein [Ignavibacteriales bacterium]|nr:DUF2723 domain-containing protein [Ignavibacteriales bacterium]
MNNRKLSRLVGLGVFLISMVTYYKTVSPTVVFWDVGEFCAAAISLQVPHPPGAPLFLLVARLVAMVPYVHDTAVRMHLISAFGSALTAMLMYFVAIRFIRMWRNEPSTVFEKFAVYGSTAIGALSLTFNKTFWFNAVEAEVYGLSMFFTSAILWLGLRWYERADKPHSDKYIILIAYIIGLAVGVHLLAILAVFPIMLMFYFRYNKFNLNSFIKFGIGTVIVFGIIYPGVVKELPSMLDGEFHGVHSDLIPIIPVVLLAGSLYGVYYSEKNRKRVLNVAMISFLAIVVGYSTYTMVYIRANAHPPMNENDPSNMARLVSYLNREQYGSAPLIKRRWDPEPDKQKIAQTYSSDFDYFLKYQFYHMYLRYHLWNYVGVSDDEKEAPPDFKQFYAIPLLLGLFGAYYHWRKHWTMAFIATAFFLIMGIVLVLYFNMQEPQPRERDYFYVGSYLIFSMWIGMGVLGLIELAREKLASAPSAEYAGYGMLALAFVFVPINMARYNYHEANRTGNYIPWDYSYNLLQSCEPDAILVTNGDNDTFPLWYLQDVEGIRRDVRVVNLSLLNTTWYIKQLKHGTPYGSKTVPITTKDSDIENIQPIQYDPGVRELPVPKDFAERVSVEGTGVKLDTSITNSGVIRFFLPNTIEFGNIKALRVQDIMVYDFIRTSNWQRPIYFAMTVADDGKIGLREYMQLRGLAFKLVPFKNPYYWAQLDEKAMRAHLFTDVKEPSTTPSYGFLWRGLQDSTTYYDEDARRLITSNYRNMFMALGLYYANIANQPAKISEVLDRMERLVPRKVIPMDYRVKFDLASFYNSAGNKERFKELNTEVINELKSIVGRGVNEQLSQYNPYVMLFMAYQSQDMLKEAEDLLPVIRTAYATQQGIDGIIGQLKSQIDARRQQLQSTPTNAPALPPGKK